MYKFNCGVFSQTNTLSLVLLLLFFNLQRPKCAVITPDELKPLCCVWYQQFYTIPILPGCVVIYIFQ